ncbi:MAG: hypothetical protein ACI4NN_06850 [Pyramidobacter sp.]
MAHFSAAERLHQGGALFSGACIVRTLRCMETPYGGTALPASASRNLNDGTCTETEAEN